MGSFTFKWPHAAEEVYVTGTFDDWSKSEKLEKVGDSFEKTVDLPESKEKILYKFVVDGNWVADHTAPSEKDSSGNDNNILNPEDFVKSTPASAAIMNSAAPNSTTAALAKDVPLEKEKAPSPPGTFPETPATDLNEKQIGVSPLPAADGAVNPVKLSPGEKVPDSVKSAGINDNVRLDEKSYEQSDRIPGLETELPPVSSNTIPESSLPIVGANTAIISSAAPNSTTAGLAAKVPLEEPAVPDVVKESQEKAGVDAEASGISSEVKEKEQVEEELLKKVPEAPSTSEGTAGKGTEKSENDKTLLATLTTAAAAVGGAALATAVSAKETVLGQANTASAQATETAKQAATQLPEPVKAALPASAQEAIAGAQKEQVREAVAPEVPAEVKESIAEAGKSPEAAANTEAVAEKAKVEQELLKEVTPVPAEGDAQSSVAKAKETVKDKAAETAAKAEEKTKDTTTTPAAADASASTPATPAKAAAAGPATPSTAERKKKNRLSSIFSKIKHKIADKK